MRLTTSSSRRRGDAAHDGSQSLNAGGGARRSFWRTAQFDTLRQRLLKLGARVIEKATRIKVMLPAACPDQAIFAHLAGAFAPSGP